MKAGAPEPQLDLTWDEIGRLTQGLSFGGRVLYGIAEKVRRAYSLGPRGAWILLLISGGAVVHPLDITHSFRIGRNLISVELAELTRARLIKYRKSTRDRRRIELTLTAEGKKAARKVREALSAFIAERLSGYSRADVLLCTRILHDIIRTGAPKIENDK